MIETGGATDARRGLALRQDEEIGPASAKPGGPVVASMHGEPEVRFVEPHRPVQVGDRQVNAANRSRRIDRRSHARLAVLPSDFVLETSYFRLLISTPSSASA